MGHSSTMRRALRRAATGRSLSRDEAAVLMEARGDDLNALLAAASAVRDAGLLSAGRPGVITYSRKVFVPLTRLCRDRCHYCTFATTPARVASPFLEREQVLAIASAGAALGCKEALFTLGDRPEDRWPQARAWLSERGYDSTLDYLRSCAVAVLETTGLLPHLNPGVLSWSELVRLKPVAPSMGMMLETTAERLWSQPGGPHYGSPDKEPAVRLRTLTDAGRVSVPFTTGILVGIGETLTERAQSLFAIRDSARTYGHVQEVIVQNFRAKPDTAMRGVPDADLDDLAATVATARLVLGPGMRLQAPPNLVDDAFQLLLRAGIDDWGGVSPLTPDHVNPERPWPQIDELARRTSQAGFHLAERLTVYPPYAIAGEPWLDPRVAPHVRALMDERTGLADAQARPTGLPWQEPDGGGVTRGRADLHASIDTRGREQQLRGDATWVYGDLDMVAAAAGLARAPAPRAAAEPGPPVSPGRPMRVGFVVALSSAAEDPARLSDSHALTLLEAEEGPELEALCRLADDVRRDAVGETVTYVVNRNINFTNVCYVGCRFCAFAQRRSDADAYQLSVAEVAERVGEAWSAGATEVCLQGGIDPDLPRSAYVDLARAVKEAAPQIHLHAFSPMEIATAAAKGGVTVESWLREVADAGLDTIPGTAAEILDDDVRWVLTKGKLPTAAWVDVVTTAHRLGLRSSATMMYGHVDQPRHWVGHLRLIAELQERTGGFTEFVPLPFVHHNSPVYLAGIARPGPTMRDNRAVHAVARLLLHGRIDHIQCSWVKLGDAGCAQILQGGADDLGGTLMEETISRMAGSQHGSSRQPSEIAAIAEAVGRPVRQRTTTYGAVSPDRLAVAPPR